MRFEAAKNSLFAILLRSPWWISIAAAGGVFALARLLLPDLYAAFVALPFLVIGAYAGWQQARAPSKSRIASVLEALRSLSWEEFAGAIEAAYRREGYEVNRIGGAQADFELVKGGRVALVACKRWKAARSGIEPLRELQAAARAREAYESIYVTAGELTENARGFAEQNNIRLLQGVELATLLRDMGRRKAGKP